MHLFSLRGDSTNYQATENFNHRVYPLGSPTLIIKALARMRLNMLPLTVHPVSKGWSIQNWDLLKQDRSEIFLIYIVISDPITYGTGGILLPCFIDNPVHDMHSVLMRTLRQKHVRCENPALYSVGNRHSCGDAQNQKHF